MPIRFDLSFEDVGLQEALKSIYQSAKRDLVHVELRYFTKHNIEHSENVIRYADKLLHLIPESNALNEKEKFILYAACLLHDIGLAYPKYAASNDLESFTRDDRLRMRKNHSDISYKVILDNINHDRGIPGLHYNEEVKHLAEMTALLAKYHTTYILSDSALNDRFLNGDRIRVRFLCALLRFADALDLDYKRVFENIDDRAKIPLESEMHKCRHICVSSVDINNDQVSISFYRFKKMDNKVFEFLKLQSLNCIRDAIRDTCIIFRKERLYITDDIYEVVHDTEIDKTISNELIEHIHNLLRANLNISSRLFLPVAIFEHCLEKNTGWRYDDIKKYGEGTGILCKISSKQTLMSHDNNALAQELIDEIWKWIQEKSGGTAFDGPTLFRVKEFTPLRTKDDEKGKTGVLLEVERTNYRYFKGTNDAFQVNSGHFSKRAWALGFGSEELSEGNVTGLTESRLANVLSVTICCIATDKDDGKRYMGIQLRNTERVSSGKYKYQGTAGGFCTQDKTKNDCEGDTVNVFSTIYREFSEEVGTKINSETGKSESIIERKNIILTGLVRDIASCFEVGFVGEIYADMDDIRTRIPGQDSAFETISYNINKPPIQWIEFSPENFVDFILENNSGLYDFMPFGLTAIVFTLVRHFGLDRVERALRRVADTRHHVMTDCDLTEPPTPDLIYRKAT